MEKHVQITQWFYGGWISLTHADNNMPFVVKSSTRTVNRIPMLMIGRIRGKPPITRLAQRALRHLTEGLANLQLLIASPLIDTLAQWLDWSNIPRTIQSEAQRLVEDARLLHWIGEQNSAQGVAPPPQFV